MLQLILEKLATPIIVGIVVGIISWAFQRKAEKREHARDQETAEKDKLRDKIESVNREINSATMELAYATAVAVERGSTNGELKRAKAAYNRAVDHQNQLGKELLRKEGK